MKGRELGQLLLTSHLGWPQRKPLTTNQLHTLRCCAKAHPDIAGEELELKHLLLMGCSMDLAVQVMRLLADTQKADDYINLAQKQKITPLTPFDARYPRTLVKRLGTASPGVLWAKGDLRLLEKRAISVVGSREIAPANGTFARALGQAAAQQGYVVVTGGARGIDDDARGLCHDSGGSVITIVPDSLTNKEPMERELLLSLYDYDAGFTAQRALERNHSIHAWGYATFVGQSGMGRGGTWSGTCYNLKNNLSPVFCFADGSEAVDYYCARGARAIGYEALQDLQKLWLPLY